ncbi:MAG: sensor histidine kinase [Alphaproteobacteria bacterium]|nr:sensor histidine kinase [Alphaproteobacteria bacterium]MBU0795832.1 sensor histidine kinase [Alphaproteobacteria bacterium]MBU0885760.1 sensor histidine kinase [Alphaproteobacteria bacterium]MBU1814463.1 sensor histidine kinase [Alphaproteobacteria bacterium]
MAAAIRSHDWSRNSLGPIDGWPVALKTAIGLMLNSKFPQCLVWGPDFITFYNDAYRPILGNKPEALGLSFRDIWAEIWSVIGPLVEKAYAGEATFIEDFPVLINRHDYPEEAYFTFSFSPVRDETGLIAGMIDTVIETTEKVQAEKQATLLNAELDHRIQNTIAMISAITKQTFQTSLTKDEAQAALGNRIIALGHAHAILTRSSWRGASIHSVIDSALSAHRNGANTISLQGPALDLTPKAVLSFSLMINELATNAVKYGALSTDQGQVDIIWGIEGTGPDSLFHLTWQEQGGPPVTPPERLGFGSQLIKRSAASDFDGQVQMTYAPEGLRCALSARASQLRVG